MSILNNFDTNANFWRVNPQLVIAFKDINELDDSFDKIISSRIMWGIALLVDSESKYKNLDEADKKALIERNYIKDDEFKWEDYKEYITLYEDLALSKVKKKLRNWENKLEERDEFIRSIAYNEITFEMLDKMMSNSKKIWDEYIKTLGEIDKEENEGVVKGGALESLAEQGRI